MSKKQNRFKSYTRKHAISYHDKTFNSKEYNFKVSSLTHSRFRNCVFPKIDFEEAAVTGSLFENCKFLYCNFKDADLEFCDFIGCEFNIDVTDGASFNNSNFINTVISGRELINCTFTGTYFYNSTIDRINLEFSTLEGACFKNCIFRNVDWRILNLEYIEVINPKTENTVFPFHQVPFMFGMLHYLTTTNDNVKLAYSSKDSDLVDKDEYLEEGIKFLINEYETQRNYFPLCNIYLFGPNTDYNKAFNYLSQEITDLSALRDFRRIKFCCKLISDSQIFDRSKLNRLYRIITSIDHSLDEDSPEMKSFTRNIGEIRRILYHKKKQHQMSVRLKANIEIEYSMRFANLIHQLQRIAKPGHSDKVYTTINLSNNSPLIIDVSIEGDECFFTPILFNLFLLSGFSIEETLSLIPEHNKKYLSSKSYKQSGVLKPIYQYSDALKQDGIKLKVMEYYLDNYFWTTKEGNNNTILQNLLTK